MRGEERRQRAMMVILEPGDRVPKEHPLRRSSNWRTPRWGNYRRCSMRCTARSGDRRFRPSDC